MVAEPECFNKANAARFSYAGGLCVVDRNNDVLLVSSVADFLASRVTFLLSSSVRIV